MKPTIDWTKYDTMKASDLTDEDKSLITKACYDKSTEMLAKFSDLLDGDVLDSNRGFQITVAMYVGRLIAVLLRDNIITGDSLTEAIRLGELSLEVREGEVS